MHEIRGEESHASIANFDGDMNIKIKWNWRKVLYFAETYLIAEPTALNNMLQCNA